ELQSIAPWLRVAAVARCGNSACAFASLRRHARVRYESNNNLTGSILERTLACRFQNRTDERTNTMSQSGVVLVVGAGDATGAAVARRFAREGLFACVARRNGEKLAPLVEQIRAEGGQARGFGCDARRED